MPKLHVLLKKEELDLQRLSGKVVVVLDILFATTSIVATLAHGAREVLPFIDGAALHHVVRAARGQTSAASKLPSLARLASLVPGAAQNAAGLFSGTASFEAPADRLRALLA